MGLPATSRHPGRPRWNPRRGFLPLVLALFVVMGHAQRDPVGRYEPSGRDANRLRRPAVSHPAAANPAKVYSLFREQDPPVPGLPPAERTPPGWGSPRRSAEAEARRPPRAQQPRRVQPPAQNRRNSALGQPQPAPWARAAPALLRSRTPQRPGAAPRGRLTGRNVCGGQCCPGWTRANSTNHCLKPVCQPPCQNRGSCSRPQLCVCRSGFRGARCEEVIPEEEFDPQNSRPAPRRSAEGAPNLRRSSVPREQPEARAQPLARQLPPARSLYEYVKQCNMHAADLCFHPEVHPPSTRSQQVSSIKGQTVNMWARCDRWPLQLLSRTVGERKTQTMSVAAFQLHFIYGNLNLNFISFSHVMEI